jgi:HPt (histidine-containing phosphotransfer) domain-containing protein
MTQVTSETEPLYSRLSADPDLSEVVEMFVEEMRDRVAAMLDQFRASDWEGLRRAAHQLKGAAGSYGFDPISPCAGRLEKAIREGEPEAQIREAVDALVEMCNRARGGAPA